MEARQVAPRCDAERTTFLGAEEEARYPERAVSVSDAAATPAPEGTQLQLDAAEEALLVRTDDEEEA